MTKDINNLRQSLIKKQKKYEHVANSIIRYAMWGTHTIAMSTQDTTIQFRAQTAVKNYYEEKSLPCALVLLESDYNQHRNNIDTATIHLMKNLQKKNNVLLDEFCRWNSNIRCQSGTDTGAPFKDYDLRSKAASAEQKLLEDTLFNSKIITAATRIILAYLDKSASSTCSKINEQDLQLLRCVDLDGMYTLEKNERAALREVTFQDLKSAVQAIEHRRSYKTYIGDFIQEVLEDIMELIPILHGLISIDRSTASIACSIFKEAYKKKTVEHCNNTETFSTHMSVQ